MRPRAAAHEGLLARIAGPRDLRALPREALPALARELRAFLLDSVAATGGHLASNLGTVELAIALHRVFETPGDAIVWDVGHQAYAHKVLTGRREAMAGLRKGAGISGFPRRCESEHDAFGTAHASTSISAALGFAHAARLRGEPRRAVAVIGDGALSGGMAFEALNHAGGSGADLAIVLNDNGMSISPAVGALTHHLAALAARPSTAARRAAAGLLDAMPAPLAGVARRAEERVAGLLSPAPLFEAIGIRYFGPVDGHDLDALLPALAQLRARPGANLLHVITRKGRGYAPAEADPVGYHGVGAFGVAQGLPPPAPGASPTFTQVFGDWICEAAARDPRVVAITPAMREGSGLVRYAREHPRRFFDVGIAEQHAVTFGAGLACAGMRPVVAIYSTFLQRGYDQMIHDVCLQELPVLFAIDRAGLVGADGPTHHGAFDLSYLRCLPGLVVMTPSDAGECRRMLDLGLALPGPSAVRYPRAVAAAARDAGSAPALEAGRGILRRRGRRAALLAFGPVLRTALEVADALDLTVADMRFVKPLDVALVARLAAEHPLLVTLEESALPGGAGAAVAETLAARRLGVDLLCLGLPDRFVDHGEPAQLGAAVGLDAASVRQAVAERLAAPSRTRRRPRAPGVASPRLARGAERRTLAGDD